MPPDVPDGKGLTIAEWVRDILKFLIDRIDAGLAHIDDIIRANDKRYEERWKAQQEAILKAESSQAQYNIAHNNLLADNRKQADEIGRRFETVMTIKESDLRLDPLARRLAVLEQEWNTLSQETNSHLQLPLHAGSLARFEAIDRELAQIREQLSKRSGKDEVIGEQRGQTNWSTSLTVTIVGMIFAVALSGLSLLMAVAGILLRLAGH